MWTTLEGFLVQPDPTYLSGSSDLGSTYTYMHTYTCRLFPGGAAPSSLSHFSFILVPYTNLRVSELPRPDSTFLQVLNDCHSLKATRARPKWYLDE